MINEWVIWGIPRGANDETILLSKIKDRSLIAGYIKLLNKKYGCRNMRVQHIDGTPPNFITAINGGINK